MAGYVLIGALAAFGLMCAVWILCGFVFREDMEGVLFYTGQDVIPAARRYLWLREMGLVRCPLVIPEGEYASRQWLEDQGIEIIDPGELSRRLGIGVEKH